MVPLMVIWYPNFIPKPEVLTRTSFIPVAWFGGRCCPLPPVGYCSLDHHQHTSHVCCPLQGAPLSGRVEQVAPRRGRGWSMAGVTSWRDTPHEDQGLRKAERRKTAGCIRTVHYHLWAPRRYPTYPGRQQLALKVHTASIKKWKTAPSHVKETCFTCLLVKKDFYLIQKSCL